ncbi:MAG: 4-(cytidine 5'-diphospho)-2-C-methyl-D-erythritol kinase [Ruminococcus sp.]|nr:4-(cytidine 5'-diphospho)-2-C-methyl-D-erythritol kinase [Ruminococcus sp.]
MKEMKLKSAAKINLSLDVVGKLENGYHLIESVFQTIGIYDTIEIKLNDRDVIELSCSESEIPCDKRNIAYKAAELFREECNIRFGCKISIDKKIPSQAGMGGGSSDGAAVLYGLNKMLETNYPIEKMIAIGKKLGADVPFFLIGGTAYVEGIGEKIKSMPSYSGRIIVAAKGKEGVSTAEAYAKIDSLKAPFHPQTKKLTEAIKNGGNEAYLYFGNIFESAVSLQSVNHIKSVMMLNGADNSIMTGSGSAVFGIFNDISKAISCSRLLKSIGYYSEICNTIDESFIIQ